MAALHAADRSQLPENDLAVERYTAEVIAHMRDIYNSDHPDDTLVVRSTEAFFLRNDRRLAPIDLGARVGIYDWLTNAPLPEAIAFLQWNRGRQQAFKTRLLKDQDELIKVAVADADQIVQSGILPARTSQLVRAAAKNMTLIGLDCFESGQENCDAYFRDEDGTHTLAISNLYIGGEDGLAARRGDMQRVFNHELIGHAVAAEAGGGLDPILPGGAPSTWLNEAWVEHCAQVTRRGRPYCISPWERGDRWSAYMINREVAHLMLRGIPLHLVGEAFLEPLDGESHPARQKLNSLLHKKFDEMLELPGIGPNVAGIIGEQCSRVPTSKSSVVLTAWRDHLESRIYGDDYCGNGQEWFEACEATPGEVLSTRQPQLDAPEPFMP